MSALRVMLPRDTAAGGAPPGLDTPPRGESSLTAGYSDTSASAADSDICGLGVDVADMLRSMGVGSVVPPVVGGCPGEVRTSTSILCAGVCVVGGGAPHATLGVTMTPPVLVTLAELLAGLLAAVLAGVSTLIAGASSFTVEIITSSTMDSMTAVVSDLSFFLFSAAFSASCWNGNNQDQLT